MEIFCFVAGFENFFYYASVHSELLTAMHHWRCLQQTSILTLICKKDLWTKSRHLIFFLQYIDVCLMKSQFISLTILFNFLILKLINWFSFVRSRFAVKRNKIRAAMELYFNLNLNFRNSMFIPNISSWSNCWQTSRYNHVVCKAFVSFAN